MPASLAEPLMNSGGEPKVAFDDSHLPYTSTEPHQPVRLKRNVTGKDDVSNRTPTTVCQQFEQTVAAHGDKLALTSSDGKKTWTWSQYYNQVNQVAKSFIHAGLKQHECINIIGFNSPEWFMADVGAIAAGGIAAGIYTTNGPDACHYVADHSKAAFVVCEGRMQLNKFLEIQDRLPNLKGLIVYNYDESMKTDTSAKVPIYMWEDFVALGKDVPTADLDERKRLQTPGHCCTLIYTSGTTGPPKAVMISHDNITFTASSILSDISINHEDCMVSYLPLSHIAAQMLDLHVPIMTGYQIYFARPDALKGTITQTLAAAQPTVFFGVPRVWEKIQEKMIAIGRTTTGVKAKIKNWAKPKGTQRAAAMQYGSRAPMPSCFGCANKLVFSKVRAALGLQRMRYAYSAAAPITKETIDFFAALNIQIMEIFGQSECTGPATVNFPGKWKIGTVGVVAAGTVLKLAPGNDEIIYTGRHIFMGYMGMPEKTAETIDESGYLHSGDVGAIDSDGFLKITGRIKELLITSGGENVAPVLIENCIKKYLPCISNVVVIGDKRKYLTAFVTLKVEVDVETGIPSHDLSGDALIASQSMGSTALTTDQAASDPAWMEFVMAGVKQANVEAISRAQHVQKVKFLVDDFSEPTGELTPTLKLKRSVVYKKYPTEMESLYA